MNSNNMDGDIRKLLTLLKKILRNHPQENEQLSKMMDQKSFNLNLCFLTFIPMSPEELMEFEEMYEDYLSEAEEIAPSSHRDPKLDFKLSPDDVDFLRKNGIRF